MRTYAKAILGSLLLFSCLGGLWAQDNYASNIKTDISSGQKMLITYDLLSPNVGALYNVVLSMTKNGSEVVFTNAFGDFGRMIEGGREKAIVWYYKDDYTGNISDVKVSIQAELLPAPIADFEFDVVGNKLPFTVIFRNSSKNGDTYLWDFDDSGSGPGNTSTLENPEHTYLRARVYTVRLIATSTAGLTDSISKQIHLNFGELPVADFKFKLASDNLPTTVWFKNTSSKSNEYHWDFDDPDSGNKNFSSKKNPVHLYTKPGTYKVVLTVTNTSSMESHSHTEEIQIQGSY